MSGTVKPIILDETGQAIADAVRENSATMINIQTASYNEDVTLLEVKDARKLRSTEYRSLGHGLRTEFNHVEKTKATKLEVEVERQRINNFTKLQEGSTTLISANSASPVVLPS